MQNTENKGFKSYAGAWSPGQIKRLSPSPSGARQKSTGDLSGTLDYFRTFGLTNEEIRKAITPALFAALRDRES